MYVEVEPSFVHKYYNELFGTWQILNTIDKGHLLSFKKNIVNPLLTNGWPEVKNFHELPDNVEIAFVYYGNNMFVVYMYKEIYNHRELPAWHSRCTMPPHTAYFDNVLCDSDFSSPMKVGINI